MDWISIAATWVAVAFSMASYVLGYMRGYDDGKRRLADKDKEAPPVPPIYKKIGSKKHYKWFEDKEE